MIVSGWSVAREGAVKRILVPFPCHTNFILPEWVATDGRVMGRIGCAAPCRKVYEDVVLEGFSEEALRA